jgi:hypothetical protein
MRFRITVRSPTIELRGYVDELENVHALANAMKNQAVVVASPEAEDYDPFSRWETDTDMSVPPEWAGM